MTMDRTALTLSIQRGPHCLLGDSRESRGTTIRKEALKNLINFYFPA